MIWVAHFLLSLESLVIALSLWMLWVMISEASQAPADPLSPVEHPPERSLAQSLEHPPKAEDSSFRADEDFAALFTLEEVNKRGYVSSRQFHMGC